jgi:hypothetical protein
VNRDEVDEAIAAWLTEASERPVGLAKAPEDTSQSYAVMYPGVVMSFDGGDQDDAYSNKSFAYRIDCFGKDRKQCSWMSSRILEVLIGRQDGDWASEPELDGLTLYWRQWIACGPVEPSGPSTYRSIDQYRLAIGPVS